MTMSATPGLITINSADHHERLVSGLWDCFQANQGVDYLVQGSGRQIKAHRLVLDLFLSSDKLGTCVRTMTPNEMQHSSNLLDSLLEFVYTGKVAVAREQLDNLLDLARVTNFEILGQAIASTLQNFEGSTSFSVGKSGDITGDAPMDLAMSSHVMLPASIIKAELDSDSSEEETSIGVEASDLSSCLLVQLQEGEGLSEEEDIAAGEASSGPSSAAEDRTECSTAGAGPEWNAGPETARPPPGGHKTHKCETCDRTFAKVSQLVIHSRTHTGEKPFECLVCGKRFAFRYNLNNHQRYHQSDMPFTCPICSKTFPTKKTFRIHGRSHSRKKPYPCPCGKAFATLHHLETHSRIHTGEKPYVCMVCNKSFAQLNNLTRHERIHIPKA